MVDDETSEMIQAMKNSGVREAQIKRVLALVNDAQDLNAELEGTLPPYQRKDAQKVILTAMLQIFRWGP